MKHRLLTTLALAVLTCAVVAATALGGGKGRLYSYRGDVVSTSGWSDAKEHFQSRLPQGIPIGIATQVNDPGDALVKVIQVTPLVDLDAFSHVLVLTRSGASP